MSNVGTARQGVQPFLFRPPTELADGFGLEAALPRRLAPAQIHPRGRLVPRFPRGGLGGDPAAAPTFGKQVTSGSRSSIGKMNNCHNGNAGLRRMPGKNHCTWPAADQDMWSATGRFVSFANFAGFAANLSRQRSEQKKKVWRPYVRRAGASALRTCIPHTTSVA